MPQQVKLPDGTIIPDFPDNPTPQDIAKLRQVGEQMQQSMVAAESPAPAPAAPATASKPENPWPARHKEMERTVNTSFLNGILGLPELIGDAGTWLGHKTNQGLFGKDWADSVRAQYEKQQAANPITKWRQSQMPQTEVGQRAANIGSSVVGSMLYGGLGKVSMPVAATSGLTGGVGAEVAGKLSNPDGPVSKDNAVAKLVGGLAGGVGGGALTAVGKGALSSTPAKVKIAKVLTEGLTDKDIAVAARRMQQSADQGVPIVAPQAFSRTTNVDNLAGMANQAPLVQTRNILNNQVDRMVVKAKDELGRLPGHAVQPNELANRTRDKATKFFDKFKTERRQVADQHIPSLDVLKQSTLRQINKDLKEYLASNPNKGLAEEVVRAARKAMQNPAWKKEQLRRQAAYQHAAENNLPRPEFGAMPNRYLDNPEQLYGALDDAMASAGIGKNVMSSGDAEKLRNLHAAKIRDIFHKRLRGAPEETLDEFGNAKQSFPMSEHPILDEQKAGMAEVFGREKAAKEELIGKLANATGRETGAATTQSLLALFKNKNLAPRGSATGQGEIGRLQQQLAKAPGSEDASLFQDAVKTFLHDAVTESATATGTRSNPQFMEQLIKKLGNPTRGGADPRWKLTKDILLANARDMGLDQSEAREVAHGVERLLVMAARTSQRGGAPGVTAGTIMNEASPEALRRIGGFNAMSVLRQPALALQRVHEKRILQTMDKWMTTPEGLWAMRELSKATTYKDARSILTALGNSLMQADGKTSEVGEHTSTEQ